MTQDWTKRGGGVMRRIDVSGGTPGKVTVEGPNITHLELEVEWQVDYLRDSAGRRFPRGFYFRVRPVCVTPDGPAYFSAWSWGDVLLEEGKRFNPRRVSVLLSQVEAQIQTQSGPVWAAIVKVLQDHRLTWPADIAIAA